MRRLWSIAVSLRVSAALLAALVALLLLHVALPQAATDPEAYARAVRSGPVARLLLVRLQLGSVVTSVPFVALMAALFVNLAAVLVDRLGTTLRRLRVAAPNPAQLAALLGSPTAVAIPGARTSAAEAAAALGRMGYRTAPAGPSAVWGVKHRLALLGFPIFHASFFLVLAGGLQIFLTRHVATLLVTEGQEADSRSAAVVRTAPLGAPPPVRLALERVDTRMERGRPVDLAAAVAVDGGEPEVARVNHPVTRGALTVLVEGAGLAPVLWLVDARGYTLDRVLVPVATPRGLATRLRLGPGDVEVAIDPVPVGPAFPERGALQAAPISMRVSAGGAQVFDGPLRIGDAVAVGDRTLRLAELRYWARFQLVSERGGGLLVAGFVLSVLGIVWRMLLFRRELVVAWDGEGVRIAGRCEFFPARFRRELALARDIVVPRRDPPAGREAG